jgi:hypothetical protein
MEELSPVTPQKTTKEVIDELKLPNEKMRAWLHHYFGDARFNKTAAARKAGYKDPYNSGRDCYLATKEFIEQEFNRQYMSAAEIAVRFAEMATFDPTEFIGKGGHVDVDKIREHGLGWMIQEMSSRSVRDEDGNWATLYTVKFHSQAKALEILGRYVGLEKSLVIGNVVVMQKGYQEVNPDDWDNAVNITENQKDE